MWFLIGVFGPFTIIVITDRVGFVAGEVYTPAITAFCFLFVPCGFLFLYFFFLVLLD